MDLRLRKFNPGKMADDKVCVFIGKRNTGKSTLVTDILWYKKHLPAGIVLSATESNAIISSTHPTSSSMVTMTGRRSNV